MPRKSSRDGFNGIILSIGPKTDKMLTHFNLDDSLIPCFCILAKLVCSSKWESTMCTAKWGLTYKQAMNISKAMEADIKGEHMEFFKVCCSL